MLGAALSLHASVSPTRAQQGLPPIQKVPHLFIQTEVLGVRGGVTRSLGKGTIEASPGRPGTLTLPLDLGPSSADHPTSIEIQVTQNDAGESAIGLTVATTVAVTSRSGEVSRIRRERVAQVEEGRSFFHQAYENSAQGTSVLLTMTPESRIVPQVVKATHSAPVIFNVSLSSVTPHGEVPLETNVLRTLENSPVSYAFRVTTAKVPVEATPAPEVEAPGEPGAAPVSEPSAAPAPPGSGESPSGAAQDAKSEKAKKAKPKKLSRKERERQALDQFQRSKEAGAASAAGSAPEAKPATGSPGEATATASAPDGGSSPGGPAPPTPPAREGTAEAAAPPAAPAGAPPPADELELTLLPHRVESGILMVEASLRGRAGAGSQRATLVQRTQAVTSNGSFDITVSGMGPSGAGSYRFSVQARF